MTVLRWLERAPFLPPVDSYLGAILHTLWGYSPHVLLAGLLFSLTGIPAFSLFLLGAFLPALLLAAATLTPAWIALIATLLELYGPKPPSTHGILLHMGRAWLQNWSAGLALGLALIFPIAAFLVTLPMLNIPNAPQIVWIGLLADFWLLALLAALAFYVVPLRIQTDVGWIVGIRIGAQLASRNIAHTIGLLGLTILMTLSISFLSSGLWFVLPAIWTLFIAGNYNFVASHPDR